MRVVVPFDATAPKTRLAPVLNPTDREEFAQCMLHDVLDAVGALGDAVDVTVLSTAPLDVDTSAPVHVDDRPLSDVVNDAISETVDSDESLAVVMADLALATPEALDRLVQADGDVVLVPGRGVGTNALVVRQPAFRVDFHGSSYLDHRRAAADVDATVETVDSFRLSTDVDEPDDLVEAFVHGGDRTTAWLASRFELVVSEAEGRVSLARR